MAYRLIALTMLLTVAAACSESKPPTEKPGEAGTDAVSAARDQAKGDAAYPLEVCVVSGEKLGSMGDPIVLEVQGTTVKLCCEGCRAKLMAEPAKYLAKLEKGADAATKTHSGEHDHAH